MDTFPSENPIEESISAHRRARDGYIYGGSRVERRWLYDSFFGVFVRGVGGFCAAWSM